MWDPYESATRLWTLSFDGSSCGQCSKSWHCSHGGIGGIRGPVGNSWGVVEALLEHRNST